VPLGRPPDDEDEDPFPFHDEERAEHGKTWSEDPIPPKEKSPFNRDWRLPKGPF
jgi:hypothetical protein